MNNNSLIVGILVVAVIAIVGYLAYTKGYFEAKTGEEVDKGFRIDIGSTPPPAYQQ